MKTTVRGALDVDGIMSLANSSGVYAGASVVEHASSVKILCSSTKYVWFSFVARESLFNGLHTGEKQASFHSELVLDADALHASLPI